MPQRLKELLRWLEEPHSTEEAAKRIEEYIREIKVKVDALQEKRQAIMQKALALQKKVLALEEEGRAFHEEVDVVKSVAEFLGGHRRDHATEPVQAIHGPISRQHRREVIMRAVNEIIEQGKLIVSPEDVAKRLQEKTIGLEVKYPTTVIGNVLARSPEFRRLERNKFEFIGRIEK